MFTAVYRPHLAFLASDAPCRGAYSRDMSSPQKPFKRPPKRFQPKGLSILYEDRDIIVVDKHAGVLTVSNDKVREHTATWLLTDYVRKGNPKSPHRVFIVHRLDRDTSGVIVFAKNPNSKRVLQDAWADVQKTYVAIVHGVVAEKQGVMTSYLAENSAFQMYSVKDPALGKLAQTGYRVLRESAAYSLLEIDLRTGRKNQIRVHCADRGFPVVGDKKYGNKLKDVGMRRLMLHAAAITFNHPHSGEPITIEAKPPVYFEILMKGSILVPRA